MSSCQPDGRARATIRASLALVLLAGIGSVSAQEASQLKVFKYINGDVNPAGYVFSVTVSCSDPVFEQVVQVPSEGYAELTNIPVPNTCTVTENLPLPAPPPGYQWNPENTPPAPITVVVPPTEETLVAVFNSVLPLGGSTGTLIVSKTVTGASLSEAFFDVRIQCPGKPGVDTTIQVPSGGTASLPDVPAPATCTVTELAPLPAPPSGWEWDDTNTPPPPQQVTIAVGETTTIDLVNSLIEITGPGPGPGPGDPRSHPVPVLAPLAIGLLSLMAGLIGALRLRRRV